MKIYWLPREEIAGNFPVWSEYDFESNSELDITVYMMLFVFTCSFPAEEFLQVLDEPPWWIEGLPSPDRDDPLMKQCF